MSWALGLALMGFLIGGISQSFGSTDTRSRARQGVVGDWVYSDPTARWNFGLNSSGQVAQVGTIVVDTATDSATYTFTINGVVISFVNGTSSTTTTTAVLLAAAVNAEPLVRGQVRASASTATVTLTALTPGVSFTASDIDAKLTTTQASTAAASASSVAFGRAIIRTGLNTNGIGGSETERLVAVPTTALFTAQVQTLTVSYVSTAIIEVTLYEIRGTERVFVKSAIFPSATDLATTTAGIATAANAVFPANTVDVTSTSTTVVFTAEIAGYEFDIEAKHNATSTEPTLSLANTTGPTEATSLHRAFRGISLFSPSDEASAVTSTEGSYAANAGVKYAERGVIWIASDDTLTSGDTVYVELAAGSTAGRFYNSSSSTRVALSRARAVFHRDGIVAADSLGAIRLEA